ncbi:unnamed protein product [Pylaiella littoralis]
MGASPSNVRQRDFVAEIGRWPGFVERTCLTPSDVSTIAAAFRKASEHSEGDYLVRTDFEHWLDMGHKPKPVEDRLFELFLVNPGEDKVSLYDFVLGIVNYGVDGKDSLFRLAFDVYDRHTTGTITDADLEGMLIDVWGVPCKILQWLNKRPNAGCESVRNANGYPEKEQLARGLLAERAGADPMLPGEWENFCRVYPNLLHPIYKLQRTLQQDLTIGKKRWSKVNQRLKKRKASIEAQHARIMHEALTDDAKQEVKRVIEAEEASAGILRGTKSQRIVAARQATDARERGLLPAIAISPEVQHRGPHVSTLTKRLDVQSRLQAAKRRSTVLGKEMDTINWDENPLNKSKKNSTSIPGEDLPKFTVATRKVKGPDISDEAGDGDGLENRLTMTAGSNGATRSPMGSPSNSTQNQDPTRADAGLVGGSTSGDHRASVGGTSRIGGGHSYPGSAIGSPASGTRSREASDQRNDSRVGRPSSGDLAQTRASVAMVTRNSNETTAGMKRKTSVAVAGLKYTQRPSIAAKAGRKPSVAIGAGASKRSSVAAYREGRKDLLSNARKVSQQGVGSGRKPSRAVVAAGS